jgi:hypothetical protein
MKPLATLTALGLGLVATIAAAHHSFASFDQKKLIDIQGFVVAWQFGNPHSHLIVKVPQATGAVTWDIEANSVNIMRRQGWSRDTLKPGDPVHVRAHPMKDGTLSASLFYLLKPDGTRLYTDISR